LQYLAIFFHDLGSKENQSGLQWSRNQEREKKIRVNENKKKPKRKEVDNYDNNRIKSYRK
jgi:hypothetical protein